jgi:hypothetical protein
MDEMDGPGGPARESPFPVNGSNLAVIFPFRFLQLSEKSSHEFR